MKEPVVIKSFPDGISFIMNPEVTYEEILEDVATKFNKGKKFFGNANTAICVEGRRLSPTEEIELIDTIKANCELSVYCIINKDSDKVFARAVKQMDEKLSEKDDGCFYKGNLTDNKVIESTKTIVVIGDVNPGCAVISSKNIIVLGGLYGEAFAGDDNKNNHFILALEMAPERMRIGDYKYKPIKQSKWGIKPKIQPKIAYVKNDEIVFDVPNRSILSKF